MVRCCCCMYIAAMVLSASRRNRIGTPVIDDRGTSKQNGATRQILEVKV